MNRALCIALALATAACGVVSAPDAGGAGADAAADAPADAPTPDTGPACTLGLWDPEARTIDQWPDPRFSSEDPSSPTGVRLRVDAARFAATLAQARGFSSLLTDLAELDGFGVNAQAFFRFGRALDPARLPSAEATRGPVGGVGFVVLSPGAPRLEGALLSTTDDDHTLLLAPLRPLPAGARVAAYVTRRLAPAAGGCLEPSAAQARALADPAGAASPAVRALVALGAIEDARGLVALSEYATQTTTDDSRAVAADIARRDFTVRARRPCADDPMGRFRACELEFVAGNYLDARRHLVARAPGAPAAPASNYTLRVTAWLPRAGAGAAPYRTIVFGHGLGGDRGQAARLAAFAAPQGIATVALDAVMHGEHPLNPNPRATTLVTVLGFFALDPSAAQALDARALRDHFRQSSYDKLQLVRLLQAGVDADGDGAVDLDAARLAYLGVSLGGIMGPEPLALTDAFGAAVLVVPGGRVSAIISESATFGPLITAVRPPGTTPGDVARTFPLLQTLLERGDAASYAPHVLRDRLAPGGARAAPSVLVGVVLDDDTVPNVSNYTLARALGVGVVPPLLRPAPGLATTAAPPLAGNFAEGRATGGLLQFDVIGGASPGEAQRATHSNVGASDVGAEAWLHFLRAHWDRGLAEIADPYAALGRAHAGP
ncbi:MAG: hypothetical protein HY909_00025 [Deltaproteobacteria bacterium]|nr:hypothetical protein [Deltaproteobacteria bacterium]